MPRAKKHTADDIIPKLRAAESDMRDGSPFRLIAEVPNVKFALATTGT